MDKILITGRVLAYDEEERLILVRYKHSVRTYYLQRSMINKIGKYIAVSRFIQFVIYDQPRIYRKRKVYNVEYVTKVMAIRYRKNIVYYDVNHIKLGTRELINNLQNKMFLDLEMSMHPYNVDKNFKQEVIQVGIYLVDSNNNLIEKYSSNVRPTLFPKLTRRTLKFLGIAQEEIDAGVHFKDFYEVYQRMIKTYNPAIIVWGRNDFLALRDGYKINNLPTLHRNARYINLLKLHKNFFNLKNDLGLFNALRLYTEAPDNQLHNALEDAMATFEIYKGFKKVINYNLSVDISKFK